MKQEFHVLQMLSTYLVLMINLRPSFHLLRLQSGNSRTDFYIKILWAASVV
jgi:hypothetical protein